MFNLDKINDTMDYRKIIAWSIKINRVKFGIRFFFSKNLE